MRRTLNAATLRGLGFVIICTLLGMLLIWKFFTAIAMPPHMATYHVSDPETPASNEPAV